MKINILGTDYNVIINATVEDYSKLKRMDGYTDFSTKTIVVADFETSEDSIENLNYYKQKVLKHEIIHAFLYESGLAENSDWAGNEEMVDWFAMQFNKINKIFNEVE